MSLSKFTPNLLKKNRAGASICCVFQSRRGLGSAQPEFEKTPENDNNKWNKAVTNAERLVGRTTSFIGLKWLFSEEVANIAVHMRKLSGSGSKHPLVKTVKGLILNTSNNMQTWGLVVLLVSKALGHNEKIAVTRTELNDGYLYSQRALAEITEMIRTSHIIHKGLMNLPKDVAGKQLDAIVSGNKIALLCGDHLLSTSCLELANLQNQDLVELMSSAVRDLSESDFIGVRDYQNFPIPSPPRKDATTSFRLPENPLDPVNPSDALGNAKAEWTLRNTLEGGNLLGKSCQGTLILAGHSATTQIEAYQFGLNLALARQAFTELQPFAPGFTDPFSLVSAPVLFTLHDKPDLYEELVKGHQSVDNVDYDKIRKSVLVGPGIEMTKELCREHCYAALEFLYKVPDSDARQALEKIVYGLSWV